MLALSCGYICYYFRGPLRVPPYGGCWHNLASLKSTLFLLNMVYPSEPVQVHSLSTYSSVEPSGGPL